MPSPSWAVTLKSLTPLLYVAALALLITIFSHAQAVLVPILLAVMLSFILTPLVTVLEHLYLPRVVAVAIVVLLTLCVISGFGYILQQQFTDLASRLPAYSTSIREKLSALRSTRQGAIANIEKTVENVTHELDEQEHQQQAPTESAPPPNVKKNPQPVTIVQNEPSDIDRLRAILTPVFEPLTTAGIILVLVIFMLMQREDLRNRFLRLTGQSHLTLTTKVMDEAGQRISRFLLTQFVINMVFGVCIALGLLWIGVPYAMLWGAIAAFLRFVPYLGAPLAMLLPTALAFVIFTGWSHTLLTAGLFLTLDLVTANAIEPLVVGHNTGVSSLAILVMALFWTWLWGPIGLVLATPLTVCLAVIGRHVPQLEFLAVLLGDDPVLEPEVSYYQRLLAHDEEEASAIVERALHELSPVQTFDTVLVPALILTARAHNRQEISDQEQRFIFSELQEAAHQLIEAISETVSREPAVSPPTSRARILIIPARTEGAEITLQVLCSVLSPTLYFIHRLSTAALAAEVLAVVQQEQPDLVCITALPPGGTAHARYLCKRLHQWRSETRILVVRPGLHMDREADREVTLKRLREAGADAIATSIAEAQTCISQMLFPVLLQSTEPRPLVMSPPAESAA